MSIPAFEEASIVLVPGHALVASAYGIKTKSTEVRVERGSYEFICTVGDHAELGMRGTLKVD